MIKNDVMTKVEEMICSCVNSHLHTNGISVVTTDNVYLGKKNIPFARAVARNFIFDVLHNKYGFSYSSICQRGGCNRESVMRCVRKCHDLSKFNPAYRSVSTAIEEKLKEWYGE